MAKADQQNLEDWFQELIQESRQREDDLEGMLDLSSPCQIEVFWLDSQVEAQLIVSTHDTTRDDLKVHINGPLSGPEFVPAVAETSKEERWQQPLPNSSIVRYPHKDEPVRADLLAGFLSRFVDMAQGAVFNEYTVTKRPFKQSTRLWGNSSIHMIIGDARNYDTEDFFENNIDGQQDSIGSEESSSSQENPGADSEREPAVGGHIYPPVWVEGPPEKTFEERVWNRPEITYDLAVREEFLDEEIMILRDGLVLVLLEDSEEVRQILNTIFSVGALFGHELRALQGSELVSAQVGSDGKKSHSASLSGRRAELLSPGSENSVIPRTVLPKEALTELIDIGEQVYNTDRLREKMLLHLQARTHLTDYEYTASFLLNWNIVEQQIIDILDPHLRDEYDVNYDRRSNITDSRNWFISHLLEVAEMTNAITPDQYSALDDFRSKRNRIVHDMETASQEEAEELSEMITDFLQVETENTIEQ